jgi:hypothetical protein
MRPVSYVLGLLAASTLLMWVDHSPSDVANQAAMLVLVVSAAALGFAAPRWAWLSALVLGGCLAVTHVMYLAAGVALPYAMSPTGWAGPATLLILIIPAGIAALSRSGRGRAGATAAVVRSRMTSDSG